MKIGLDFHGVISAAPKFFVALTDSLIKSGHEIHIITGVKFEEFLKLPATEGIYYTHFYSITDDFLEQGIPHHIDKSDRPIFKEELWNQAKAEYCRKEKIDIMLDDSKVYGKHFVTPYFNFWRV